MHFAKQLFLLIISASLVGCAAGPNFHSPAAPASARYTDKQLAINSVSSPGTAGKAQQFQPGQDIPAQWWRLFRSKALTTLVAQGLANSPTLDAASAALRQAQENLAAQVGSGLFPTISSQLAASRQKDSNSSFGTTGGNLFNLYNASVDVSYNLDLFGGSRRQLEALHAQVDYQQFEWEAAYLSLSANIVTTAVIEASLRGQINVTQQLITSQENELRIVQQQLQLGGVSQTDVLAQQSQLAQTRATLPPLQKSLGQYQNSLAVLVGALPSEAQLPSFSLDQLTLPEQLPISLPSRLVQQRPDIRAAESLLHKASAEVGVAAANRLPQLSLTGSYGYSSNYIHELFASNTSLWSLGGQLTQPIFNAGALKAKQNAALAAYDQANAQYRQIVLQAFQNVADSLYAIQTDAQALRAQTAAENAAYASYALLQKRYQLGAISYVAQLDAQRQYQQAKIARIQAQAARYADTAALFQALGGGWWNRS